jgi:signal transduction histidine kinase
VPPIFSPTVAEPQNALTLIVMVVAAVLVAVVVDRAARRAEEAVRARTEAALLASFARTVLTSPKPLDTLLEKVRESFGLTSVALLERQGRDKGDDQWLRVGCVGALPCYDPDEADVDVAVTPDVHLALRGRQAPARDRRVLEAAAGQALLALRQQRMAAEAADVRDQAETTKLRTALLSAVGHDLRTPLTSIKAAVGSLRAPDLSLSEEDTAELLATVEESADRLTGLVDNLLDSSRLAAGAVRPVLRPVGYDEIVARALSGVDDRSRLTVDVDEYLPPVVADVGLIERVVANIVDNALRHGVLPAHRPVDVDGDGRVSRDEPEVAIRASAHADQVELRIVDHGQGLPRRAAESAFEPFQRLGDRNTSNGVGLGLSVARGFVDAMGGTIRAEGARVPGARRRGRHQRAARHREREARRDRARPRPARPGRHGRPRPAAPVEQHTGDRAVRAHGSCRQVRALDAGADDYVTKPFGMDELLARLRAAVRRAAAAPGGESAIVENGTFSIDLAAKKVRRGGVEVHLTPTEWGLLEVLVRNPGKLISKRQLLREVWGEGYDANTHYLRVYFAQLRRKLEPEPSRPRHLITEPGMGYRFEL